MSAKTEPNDLAYPSAAETVGGLTKRELFAAMAMQSIYESEFYFGDKPDEIMAEKAVKSADALIEALNK